MCKLWITEPRKSWIPSYFVIEEIDAPIDEIGEALVDLGYDGPPAFASTEAACQFKKENNLLLLHEVTLEENRCIVGLSTPLIANASKAKRDGMLFRIFSIIFIIYLGIVLGIALAGLGVRGDVKPYLLEWLFQNRIVLSGLDVVLFIIPAVFCYNFFNLDIPSRNYEATINVQTDITALVNRFCTNLQTETITVVRDPRNPEDMGLEGLQEVVRESLEQLVLVVDGLNEISDSILDINLKPIEPDFTRTY
jgi:hypothetical protein